MVNFKIIKSQKNKENIVCENYIYNYNGTCKNYISWRCVIRGCTGMLKTTLDKSNIVSVTNHIHEPDSKKLARMKFRNTLKDVSINSNEDFLTTFIKLSNDTSHEDKYGLNKYDSYRDYFNRLRNMKSGLCHKNESDILESFKYTFGNELFLQFDSGINDEERIILFHTDLNSNIFLKSKVWLVDGTFYTAPNDYEQILILHCSYFSKIIPLIYVIMKRKNTNSYDKVFSYLTAKTINASPDYIISDFESALYNSIKNNFKSSILNGCNFHMTQIIMRYLSSSHLMYLYKENNEFRKSVKYLIILSYLPEEEVIGKFNILFEKIKRKDDSLKNLFNYFYKNFLSFENKESPKNISFWSVYNRIINDVPTTTNSCEAYHRYLNSNFSRKNQKLEKVIDMLKKEEVRTHKKIMELKSGRMKITQRKSEVVKNIVRNRDQYEDDEYFDTLERELNIYCP
ncbi:hypothetical protein DMUE_3413 [Dictyocoela muelleri]|nr:hypothetical protein DMUE_3413 [Dictyocoela muelleri]